MLTDSDVGKASATSGASTTATVSFSRAAYGFGFAFDQSSSYSAGMSASCSLLRDLGVLFILATLATRSASGAYEPNAVIRFREDYQKHPPTCCMTEGEGAWLLLAVRQVRKHPGQRTPKDG